MTTQIPNLREMLNNSNPVNIADCFREIMAGSLLGFLIQSAGFTQTAVVPTAGNTLVTFAAAIAEIYDLIAVAGTFTGRLTLKIKGDDYTPTTGEAVWAGPGSTTIRLNPSDAITSVSAKYARLDASNCVTSDLNRNLGQRD